MSEKKYIDLLVSLDEDDIAGYVVDAIGSQHKERLMMLRAAFKLGLDPNFSNEEGVSLLTLATRMNDIGCIGLIIKQGGDISRGILGGSNLLILCAMLENTVLLKYYIENGLGHLINKDDGSGFSPLMVACDRINVDCVKLLIANGADCSWKRVTYDEEMDEESAITCLLMAFEKIRMNKLNEKKKEEVMGIVDMLMGKKVKVEMGEVGYIKKLILAGELGNDHILGIVKKIVGKFPEVVNVQMDRYELTLLHFAIMRCEDRLIEFLLGVEELDLEVRDVYDRTYLHSLCVNVNLRHIEMVVERCPKLLGELCDNGRSVAEYALLEKDNGMGKSDEEIIGCLKYLVAKGVDIGRRNNFEMSCIEIAIQFCTPAVVEAIVDLKREIIEKDREVNDVFPPGNNNDHVCFAIQLGKFDMFELLIRKGARLHVVDLSKKAGRAVRHLKVTDLKMPTALIFVVMYMRYDFLLYLVEMESVKPYVNLGDVRAYLANFAVEQGCTDVRILEYFTSREMIQNIEGGIGWDAEYMGMKNDLNFIRKYFNTVSLSLLRNLSLVVEIIGRIFTFSFDDHVLVLFGKINDLYDMYDLDDVESSGVGKLVMVIGQRIGHLHVAQLNAYLTLLRELQWGGVEDDDEPQFNSKRARQKIDEMKNLLDDRKIRELRVFEKSVGLLMVRDKRYKEYERELKNIVNGEKIDLENLAAVEEVVVKSEVKISSVDPIEKKLFKLSWPEKVEHYDRLYGWLKRTDYVVKRLGNGISITDVQAGVNATVIGLSLSKDSTVIKSPSCWFKTYGPHIGNMVKNDMNHLFPFGLDGELGSLVCIEKIVADPTCLKNGVNSLLYFFGTLSSDPAGKNKIYGCFEYFINSRLTLFHRMFRPLENLQPWIKKLLNQRDLVHNNILREVSAEE
ncbi:MAG: ankyrin repeat-containing protein [Hyperionvirus sp.]|uniref:Ankyrin repeat-containing protein n=1 Tax=Hyperionvirus sp. TaxID=2487770 RepID=A0A3G5A5U5_9VIRU|nr:MAG: ankyrin repeat-containing protein [Hyperionvirus sp.]